MARANSTLRALRQHVANRRRMGFGRSAGDNPWGSGHDRFTQRIEALDEGLLPEVIEMTYESIVEGSPTTGSPGQPEQSGDLIASWDATLLSPTEGAVVSSSPYAIPNEDGVHAGGKPYVQHSSVGGRHSVAITRRNFQALVDAAGQTVAGDAAA